MCVVWAIEKLALEAGLTTPISNPRWSQSPRSGWAGSLNRVTGRKGKQPEWKHCPLEQLEGEPFPRGYCCLSQQREAQPEKLRHGGKAHLRTLSFLCQFLLAAASFQFDILSLLPFVPLLKNLTKGVTLFCQRLSLLEAPHGYLRGASSDFCWIFFLISNVMTSLS